VNRLLYTLGGIFAVLTWAASYSVGRSLIAKVGFYTALSGVHLLAGIIVALAIFLTRARDGQFSLGRFSLRHTLTCGTFCVAYIIVFYAAIHAVARHSQVIEVSLIVKLWSALTLIFSLFILKNRARPALLAFGTGLSLTGVFLAVMIQNHLPFSLAPILENIRESYLPYLLAALAALLWPLYSNFSRLFVRDANPYSIAIFVTAAGVCFLVARLFVNETSHWNTEAVLEFLYMAIFPAGLAYLLWARAMEKGSIVAVVAFSYLSPLFSSMISALYLRFPIELAFWPACLMVIAGAWLSKMAVQERS